MTFEGISKKKTIVTGNSAEYFSVDIVIVATTEHSIVHMLPKFMFVLKCVATKMKLALKLCNSELFVNFILSLGLFTKIRSTVWGNYWLYGIIFTTQVYMYTQALQKRSLCPKVLTRINYATSE